MLAAIEWSKIGELLWAAPAAAIVVSIAFALVVLGTARADESRRDGAAGVAVLYGGLAFVAGAVFVATVVFGIQVITTK